MRAQSRGLSDMVIRICEAMHTHAVVGDKGSSRTAEPTADVDNDLTSLKTSKRCSIQGVFDTRGRPHTRIRPERFVIDHRRVKLIAGDIAENAGARKTQSFTYGGLLARVWIVGGHPRPQDSLMWRCSESAKVTS